MVVVVVLMSSVCLCASRSQAMPPCATSCSPQVVELVEVEATRARVPCLDVASLGHLASHPWRHWCLAACFIAYTVIDLLGQASEPSSEPASELAVACSHHHLVCAG